PRSARGPANSPATSPARHSGTFICVSRGARRRKSVLAQQLPQLGLQYLAVVVLRQGVDEAVVPRPLETCDVLEAERVELGLADGGAGAGDDEGDDLLARIRVRAADDRPLGDRGMAQHHLLDLARIDVGAAGDDQVLGAIL